MNNYDYDLLEVHPELRFTLEFISPGILSPRAIYDHIRLLSFKIMISSHKDKTDKVIEDCIRKANITAIKETWGTFLNQYKVIEKMEVLTDTDLKKLFAIKDTDNAEENNL